MDKRTTLEAYEKEHLDDSLECLVGLVIEGFQNPRLRENFLNKIDFTSLSTTGPMLVTPYSETKEDEDYVQRQGFDRKKPYVAYGIGLNKGVLCYILKDEDSNDFILVPSRLFKIKRNHLCSNWQVKYAIDESGQDRISLDGL